MIILNEEQIQEIYGMKQAIKDIYDMLLRRKIGNIVNPHRTVIDIPEEDGSVLYMPGIDLSENMMTLKVVTIFPNNPSIGKSTTQGLVLLTDAKTGDQIAMYNASYFTRLRTGAISGLATKKLALKNASVLTVIGTGRIAFEQVLGVLAVRDIKEILLINRTKEKAVSFKEKLMAFVGNRSIKISILDDVSKALKRAHVICCCTKSNDPVFDGNEVQPGTHVNGVGSYLPHMREVDFNFIRRVNKIVVDDLEGVKEEAGELIYAAKQSGWTYDNIHGELMDLAVGDIPGRLHDDEITFFKSVGAAYYDLAVSIGVYKEALNRETGINVKI